MTGKIESRLAELGIELPEPSKPVANYVPYVITDHLVFVSGQVPVWGGEMKYVGRLGEGISLDDGYKAARICAVNLIAQLRVACGGNLDLIERVVKLNGFVNSTPEFADHPKVVNGASDLMAEVFGESGRHARFAVGASSLPGGVAVEIAGVFRIG